MLIGIPKEITPGENRVAAIPETVMKFIDLGFDVAVEASAGEGVFISDGEYELAGAKLFSDSERLYAQSDVIIKIKPPDFNKRFERHEVNMLRKKSILIAHFQSESADNRYMLQQYRKKNITVLNMDGVPRISRTLKMDVSYSMGIITGYKAVLMAINRMQKFAPMIEMAMGSIPPAQFLIIGAGVVGRQAIVTAKHFGGVVTVIDIQKSACNEAKRLGAKALEFNFPRYPAVNISGNINFLTEKWLEIEHRFISPHIEDADVVILSAHVPHETAPMLVTEQMVSTMKSGSVIVDIAINQGGNCEVTEPGKIIQQTGVYIFGAGDIPQKMATHASLLYANNMYYYVKHLFKNGPRKIDFNDEIIKSSLVNHHAAIHFEGIPKARRKIL
ncbi:MAG: NAD(P)(+) transhydrogenase (Re/Si-specific) subunit alpha [Desulfosalsimonadaceae bacterium]|jgi:NAD(P) transhydrogenase subunit alpha|nr:MAG: NAD(P)(+) transhydrogenase (Re/Si-specific) subunit alpha [Desulfobacteraceae bacterium]